MKIQFIYSVARHVGPQSRSLEAKLTPSKTLPYLPQDCMALIFSYLGKDWVTAARTLRSLNPSFKILHPLEGPGVKGGTAEETLGRLFDRTLERPLPEAFKIKTCILETHAAYAGTQYLGNGSRSQKALCWVHNALDDEATRQRVARIIELVVFVQVAIPTVLLTAAPPSWAYNSVRLLWYPYRPLYLIAKRIPPKVLIPSVLASTSLLIWKTRNTPFSQEVGKICNKHFCQAKFKPELQISGALSEIAALAAGNGIQYGCEKLDHWLNYSREQELQRAKKDWVKVTQEWIFQTSP